MHLKEGFRVERMKKHSMCLSHSCAPQVEEDGMLFDDSVAVFC